MQSRPPRLRRALATAGARGTAFVRVLLLGVLVLTASVVATPEATTLEAFLDDLMVEQFEAHDLVGAVVTVVEIGQPTVSKGYGYADLESLTPVDPERTLFRIGSITKLFVWTAVMQLVEQGLVDLHADVNDYLSTVRVPDTYPEPVTLAHLMAHTAGFEDRSVGLFARSPDAVRPLAEMLADGMPARVRPVGEVAAYSNHGTALAGLIVEEVSGLAWNDYLEARILAPLGMASSTGEQPVPAALEPDLARGYDVVAGSFQRRSFDYSPLAPAGSMSATGSDLARFMLAHLQDGAYGDATILLTETAQAMHRTHATNDPRLSGIAHGFIEQTFQGQRTIGHGGGIVAFNSLMVLVPEHGLGLFIAFNTLAGAAATVDVAAAFFEHRYGADGVPVEVITSPSVHRPDVVGGYRPTRAAHTTLDKLAGLLQAASITHAGDGALLARNLGLPGATRWVPIEPLVYREVESGDLLVFQEDGNGRIVRALVGSQPHLAYDALAWHETTGFHVGLVAVAVLVFLSAVVGWPLTWRWWRGETGVARLARVTAWTASTLFLVFLVSLAVVLRDPMEIAFGVPPLLRVVLAIALVGAALTLVGLLLAVRSWVRGDWGVVGRVHYGLVVLAGAAFVWFLDHWNLLGFRY